MTEHDAEFMVCVDGSCIGNDGTNNARGGWAFVVANSAGVTLKESYGKLRAGRQTNNRSELEAMLQALKWIDSTLNGFYTIYCDSDTVVNGMTGVSVRKANRDIWESIEEIAQRNIGRFTVNFINGHMHESKELPHILNIQTDKLAWKGANSLLIAPIEGDAV